MVLIFISLFIIFRQRAIENANITKRRAGKANKVATKRLKKASKLMADNKPGEFYDEVLRALWGYVGDNSTSLSNNSHTITSVSVLATVAWVRRLSPSSWEPLTSVSSSVMLQAILREI